MKQLKIKVPPIWVSLVLSVAGIIGMRFVYASITGHTSFLYAVVGTVLLVAAVMTVGTPLAYAMYLRRALKARNNTRI